MTTGCVNQGEPYAFIITIRNGEAFVPDISIYQWKAILKDPCGRIVKKWSSAEGTIEFDTVEGKGIAVLKLHGDETAGMKPGEYCAEVARVMPNGMAIRLCDGVLYIEPTRIIEI